MLVLGWSLSTSTASVCEKHDGEGSGARRSSSGVHVLPPLCMRTQPSRPFYRGVYCWRGWRQRWLSLDSYEVCKPRLPHNNSRITSASVARERLSQQIQECQRQYGRE